MDVTRSETGSVGILNLSGPFIAGEQDNLTETIDRCMADGIMRIIVNMKHTPFIDSAGIETLQSLVLEFARRGADFRITGLNDVCRDIFVATRMMSFIHVIDDAESAIRSFR